MKFRKRLNNGRIAIAVLVALAMVFGFTACADKGKAETETVPAAETPTAAAGSSAGASAEHEAEAAEAAAAEPGELFVIRSSTKIDCGSTPWVVAEKKGFFEEEGIKLEYVGEIAYAQQLPAVLNGTSDVEGTLPNGLATFINEGAAVKAVYNSTIDPPADVPPEFRHMRFYVSADSGITTVEQLNDLNGGGKITINGIVPTCASFIPNAILDAKGVDKSRLEFVTFESDLAAIQAVQQGNLDIAGVHPPFYKTAEDSGLTLLADSADTGFGAAAGTSLYYFTEEFIAAHPEEVQHFVNAIRKAQEWANNNVEESVQLTQDYIGTDVNATHYYFTGTEFDPSLYVPWLDDLEDAGAIEAGKYTPESLAATEFFS
jgi:ABC-type nitrate/sulfonate/bicarbonate transport system substrate-binding protein